MRRLAGAAAIALAMVAVLARESSGRGLSAFEQLGTQVRAEDRIVVTATEARPVQGRLVAVSGTALRLATQGTVRESAERVGGSSVGIRLSF